jgi:two-component system CheB/CheR fusion protein
MKPIRSQPLDAARPRKARGVAAAAEDIKFSIVAIGASAGGLGACMKLLAALPSNIGMAFLVVLHLEPNHESLLVELLGARTLMPVVQATDGMPIESDRVYVIPPGVLLWVDALGFLRLSKPPLQRGDRLPFDFLLATLATAFAARVVCVILSGAGADGSLGLRAVKAKGGLVLVQRTDEAEYNGMPSSAVATGEVDEVLKAAQIAARLVERKNGRRTTLTGGDDGRLSEIVAYLREMTSHDFTLYKRGTLERHVARRMARASIASASSYLAWLRLDEGELMALAREMLINVTSFFRDPLVFAYLAKDVAPALVRDHPAGVALRIWTAGCSSGEEAYSLAILFLEEISAQKRDIKLQIFASDVDADAVVVAREGHYGDLIEADVTAERLKRFFTPEGRGYRVSPELRNHVVFTVHDVLSDPPFAKVDIISCRNLLIYLLPEAQARVASAFHFALNPGGLLLLGNSEAIAADDDGFARVSRSERLYRRETGALPRQFVLSPRIGDSQRAFPRPVNPLSALSSNALAEHCRASVLAHYAPPAMLINAKAECLFVQGATDRYLKVAAGRQSSDAVSLAREGVTVKLRLAIETAMRTKKPFVSAVGRLKDGAGQIAFKIRVEPAPNGAEEMYLVCFVEQAAEVVVKGRSHYPAKVAAGAENEIDIEATRAEFQLVVRDLEARGAKQIAINDEAFIMNEEFQTKNEELMASKEELQSLNEELNALNSQLQETLERQRTLADDLQNVLYSTEVATIFLDAHLNIRFFTPATKALFRVIASDIGRPLSDLKSFGPDDDLPADAQRVLDTQTPIEREVSGQNDSWFMRRVLPYRTRDLTTEGVVITFANVTERRQTAQALDAAKRQAEQASTAKSRFLAAASHDLRQPLQTLCLIQGLLAIKVTGVKEQKLIARLEDALGAMTNMLNTLLDINLIEVGAVKVAFTDVPVADLLNRMRVDLTDQAESQGLKLIVMPCRLSIRTDPPLLEQMLRNLLSNALKYTPRGRVLLGCRRRLGKLRIEIWDTGRGIPTSALDAIFEEYHQIDNAARERSRGLGLGLSIVKSLGDLLAHPVRVRSRLGKGSVFSIEVPLSKVAPGLPVAISPSPVEAPPPKPATILIVEDDPEVREYLALFLVETGYGVECAADGPAALTLLETAKLHPDLVLADYNLPGGLTGVETSQRIRRDLKLTLPVIILTGDISKEALTDIAQNDCVQFSKPVKLRNLVQAIAKLLAAASSPHAPRGANVPISLQNNRVFVVDDDAQVRGALAAVLEQEGRIVEAFASCEAFLAAARVDSGACLLLDAYLPGMSGLALLRKLRADGSQLPTIMMTGESDVAIAVEAMKAGAVDFIAKPVSREELLACLNRAMEIARDSSKHDEWRASARAHLAGLTGRQVEVMDRVLAGQPSKIIAADLGISQRTVENHRMQIMTRTGCRSLPALARMALVAASDEKTIQIKPAA